MSAFKKNVTPLPWPSGPERVTTRIPRRRECRRGRRAGGRPGPLLDPADPQVLLALAGQKDQQVPGGPWGHEGPSISPEPPCPGELVYPTPHPAEWSRLSQCGRGGQWFPRPPSSPEPGRPRKK